MALERANFWWLLLLVSHSVFHSLVGRLLLVWRWYHARIVARGCASIASRHMLLLLWRGQWLVVAPNRSCCGIRLVGICGHAIRPVLHAGCPIALSIHGRGGSWEERDEMRWKNKLDFKTWRKRRGRNQEQSVEWQRRAERQMGLLPWSVNPCDLKINHFF